MTIQSGGTLAPGASLGTLVFNGDLNLNGTLVIKLENAAGPLGTGDFVNVVGTLDLSGGTLTIQPLTTLTNNVYVFGQYSSLQGALTATNGVPTGYVFTSNYNNLNELALQVIPEPSALTLVGAGLLGAAVLLRRRRQ